MGQRPPTFSTHNHSSRGPGFGSRTAPPKRSMIGPNLVAGLQLLGILLLLRLAMLGMGMPFVSIPVIDPIAYYIIHFFNALFARMG